MGNFWDNLGNVFERAVGGFFDKEVADSNAKAAEEARKAEELRATMIDQLSRQNALSWGGVSVGNMPTWVVPAAMLALGGYALYRFAK